MSFAAYPMQAEPYAGVAVPVEAVAQESLPLPTMQAFSHPAGSIMHVQLADGRILKVNVPPGTPPGHQIHFPVAAAPPPVMPPPPPVVSQPGVGVASVSAPETVTVNVPPGLGPGSIFRVTLTDGRPFDDPRAAAARRPRGSAARGHKKKADAPVRRVDRPWRCGLLPGLLLHILLSLRDFCCLRRRWLAPATRLARIHAYSTATPLRLRVV